ncbi:hypothetical protein UFOVP402_16 [uncultured Caudovirales phage]|uniref:Uncharacterized protein n=1 Tax=uncultured Caudovirales phage TaxID=2100421 RepID=A0A6J5M0P5_9CAUD|nr:hypothetical protein UFOVP402_16 [uncultured Caudovirales phage]
MALAHQFSEQSVEVSTDSGATWKPLVCLQSAEVSTELPLTEEDTNCGTFVGLGVMKMNSPIECVCEASPTVSQITYEDVLAFQKARQLVQFRYQNAAVGSVGQGASFYHKAEGYFVNASLTGQTGNVIKFSTEFRAIGDIDITA